jgi:hypothetical protein
MDTLTISEEGQITLPPDVMDHLGVGSERGVLVRKLPDGRIELRAATGRISDAFGMLWREGQPTLSIEEINAAIARGWAGEK